MEVCIAEVGTTEVHTTEFSRAEIGISKINPIVWIFFSPLVPDVTSLLEQSDLFFVCHCRSAVPPPHPKFNYLRLVGELEQLRGKSVQDFGALVHVEGEPAQVWGESVQVRGGLVRECGGAPWG
ncbi:MAG: hypothetical protein AAF609_15965 [Cyanobacteria bacterium P01_C01_bin.120]